MNTGDYIAASNLVLYVLGAAVVYTIKIIFARIKEGRDQSISDDDKLDEKITKLTDKIDANEVIRRETDRDLYQLESRLQIKVAYAEGYKDGESKGKNT